MEPLDTLETAPATSPAETQTETPESSTIKTMRQQLEAANRARKEAEQQAKDVAARLKEKEDAELTELERLKREVAELSPLRDSAGKFASRMESLYMEEIASVPEEKREAVERLSASGDWADRLEAIKAAKVLLGGPVAPAEARAMGAPAAPARPPVTPQPERFDPTKLNWSDAIKLTRNTP